MLLKSQRNQLIALLDMASISLGQYNIKEDAAICIVEVNDETSNHYHFQIQSGGTYAFTIFQRPGVNKITDANITNTWDDVASFFATWVHLVRREIDLPDVWAELQQSIKLFTPTATPSDDKFTRTELAEVQGQLRLLQQSFAAAALPEAARQKLIELTQTAAVKAEGFTKKDWQSWFIGSLISTITGLAFNPTQAAEVYKLVKVVFTGLFLN